jgi:hypothetical protein
MTRHLGAALIIPALLASGAISSVSAQTISGNINQPPVSPYINILRAGAPAGVNYYNIVQPQLQMYSAINQLQTQQLAPAALATLGYQSTGHPVQFSNYSHFYPQLALGGTPITGLRGMQNLQNRLQQNLPTGNLGMAAASPATGSSGTSRPRVP